MLPVLVEASTVVTLRKEIGAAEVPIPLAAVNKIDWPNPMIMPAEFTRICPAPAIPLDPMPAEILFVLTLLPMITLPKEPPLL